jgi:hypothetical protein
MSQEALNRLAYLLGALIGGGIIAFYLMCVWAGREKWRWYRQWKGGHWEHRYILTHHSTWDRVERCEREKRYPAQQGQTTQCEDWPTMQHPWLAIFSIGRYWAYHRYLARHKWFVFKAAWTMGLGWRVLLLAALHDLSKYRFSEIGPYARHFNLPDGSRRTKMAADGFYQDEDDDHAFNQAWLAHIRRNKHHPQHWVDVLSMYCDCANPYAPAFKARTDVLLEDDGTALCLTCNARRDREKSVNCMVDEMPLVYVEEMLCDWIGAGLAQGTPNTKGWYMARGRRHMFGPQTRDLIERRLMGVRVTDDNGNFLPEFQGKQVPS